MDQSTMTTRKIDPCSASSTSCGDVFHINANALILDLASQSVKLRRRRGKSFDEIGKKGINPYYNRHKETIKISERVPLPSPSRRLFDKSLPLIPSQQQQKKLLLLKRSFSTNMIKGDIENSTHIDSSKTKKRRSKALGHALRKSRDLRHARELADMLGRPLPPLPPLDAKSELAQGLADSPLELLQGPPNRPKRFHSRLQTDEGETSEDDDWAAFISRGYSLFPKPPNTKIVAVGRSHQVRNSKRMSGVARTKLETIDSTSPQSSVDEPYMTPSGLKRWNSKRTKQKTGIDWLDDELAWVSSDDEREELCKASTPPEAPSSTFRATAGLGLSHSIVSTPPSSSVETFSTFRSPTQRVQQQSNPNWRLSGVSDVFVTPTASPQIDLGYSSITAKTNRIDGKTLSSVKRAHLPMFAGLADAVSRYAAEAAGFENVERDEQRINEEDVESSIISNRHDSVSSIYSSSAMSRDFSSATTVSTRPSSVAGISECGSSASWGATAKSPTSQARMRTLPSCSTSSRVGSIDGSQNGMDSSLKRSMSASRHNRRTSDTNSSTRSHRSKHKHSSRIQFPQEGSLPPPTPIRTASLQINQSIQNQAAAAVASARANERPLLGSWLANDEEFEPMPVMGEKIDQNNSSSTIQLTKTHSNTNESGLRQIGGNNRSNVDLSTQSTNNNNPKSAFKSFFGRQRRQSTSVMLDNAIQKTPLPVLITNENGSTMMERSKSSTHLNDRVLSKMGGGNPFNALDLARPMADVPVTPTTTEDVPAPNSSPSLKIFGSASLSPVGSMEVQRSARLSNFPSLGFFSSSSSDLLTNAQDSPMTAADGLRAFAEASSASKRTSTISTKAMPSHLSSGTSALSMRRNGAPIGNGQSSNYGSLSRAKSLRSRVRGLVFDYDPSSPFYVYEDDNQIPVNTSSRISTEYSNNGNNSNLHRDDEIKVTPQRQRINGNNGKAAPPVTFWRRGGARVLSVAEPSFEQIYQQQQQGKVEENILQQQNSEPFQQKTIRRKSSFTLWK